MFAPAYVGFRKTGRSPIKGLSFLPGKADDKGRTGGAQRGRVGEQERLAEPQPLGSRICGSGVLESLGQQFGLLVLHRVQKHRIGQTENHCRLSRQIS
jgi:hypothetical protein